MAKKIIKTQIIQGKEFSKKIVVFSAFLFLICIAASYVLAWFDKNPVGELSIALSASFTGVVASYLVKSYKEKDSRNKYRVDEFGNPNGNYIQNPITESEENYGKEN